MREVRIGSLTTGAIVAGGWQAGREDWAGIDDAESAAAFRAYFDAGVTMFDTAEEYGAGHGERVLGQSLRDVRDQVLFATKVSWRNLAAGKVVEACEQSLRNLGTDRIDLYQIHWPAGTFGSPVVPLEETLGALVRLKEQGKIRAIGVSNFSADQLARALSVAPIDSLQNPFSLFWRTYEPEEVCLMAYSPLAQGLLAGRTGPFEPGDNRSGNRLFAGMHLARAEAALKQLREIAAEHRITVAQLALAWLVHHPRVCAVVGARTAAQATENAAAGRIDLDPATLAVVGEIGRSVTEEIHEKLMWDWEL
ncbi:oxidoreductase [Lentzea sp. NBRC 105346]|uniref:aldo/keto reductase n=1 Tax=Lentzea sp. NBRC 105346 TaxID=3032205 RepID=UPI0024A07217|nr:aldo/keto reductase [Lentzea sp. NBRC 105346]GLZ35862.1 oxidoreductase [Lentzea sp. NBRC 105346]